MSGAHAWRVASEAGPACSKQAGGAERVMAAPCGARLDEPFVGEPAARYVVSTLPLLTPTRRRPFSGKLPCYSAPSAF